MCVDLVILIPSPTFEFGVPCATHETKKIKFCWIHVFKLRWGAQLDWDKLDPLIIHFKRSHTFFFVMHSGLIVLVTWPWCSDKPSSYMWGLQSTQPLLTKHRYHTWDSHQGTKRNHILIVYYPSLAIIILQNKMFQILNKLVELVSCSC